MAYDYITKDNSPNYTPGSQTRAVWGVDRQIKNIAIHWWGDPAQNPQFDGIVAHLCDPNSGVSAHYVATGTGRQVACLVSPSDNSWSTMSDNPYCISIECDPRCRDEDYDVVAELVADIRSAYGNLPLVPHRQFVQTTCPGNWDLSRIDSIAANKISNQNWGDVTNATPVSVPQPTPVPVPTPTTQPTTTTTTTTAPPVLEPTTTTTTTTTTTAPTTTTTTAQVTGVTTTEAPVPVKQAAWYEVIWVTIMYIIERLQGKKR
jgi:hypothetical protein